MNKITTIAILCLLLTGCVSERMRLALPARGPKLLIV